MSIETTAPKKKSGYLPSLDGWRAVAVLGVMFTHDYDHQIGKYKLGFLHDYGGYGVILFFAISGILITTRILEEERLRGRLDLRGFYIRRILRIQPAAVVYLLIGAMLVPFGFALDGGLKYWIGSLFFFRNYLPNDVTQFSYFATGHFWTLAVEEHFYLLLSLLIYFFRQRRVVIFGLIALIAGTVPHVLAHWNLVNQRTIGRTTQENLWYLIWPAFLAVLLHKSQCREFAIKFLDPWKVMLGTVLVFTLRSIGSFHHGVFPGGRALHIILLFFPFLLIGTMLHPRSWSTRLLELKPFRFIGRISYSLYIWHVVFFLSRWTGNASDSNPTPHWFTHAPWNYIPAFACALLSFYIVEKPMMRLGHRLAPPATPGRSDLVDAPTAS